MRWRGWYGPEPPAARRLTWPRGPRTFPSCPFDLGAEDKNHALAAASAFDAAYGAKFPKAAAKITDDMPQLLAFFDYPEEHWMHLRELAPHPWRAAAAGCGRWAGISRPHDMAGPTASA